MEATHRVNLLANWTIILEPHQVHVQSFNVTKIAYKLRNGLIHGNTLLAGKFLHTWIDGEFAKPFPSRPFAE